MTQRAEWSAPQPGPGVGGALATAGDVVFEGNIQGGFRAFDARSGKELWQFQAQTAVQGTPVSYVVGDEQYVVVLSGYGGSLGLTTPLGDGTRIRPNGRVLAFKLGGTAQLPKWEEPQLPPLAKVATWFSPAQIATGKLIFETTCSWCHGSAAQASGVAPDLRRSLALDNAGLWRSIVIGGVLKNRGMASFRDIASDSEAEAIRGYLPPPPPPRGDAAVTNWIIRDLAVRSRGLTHFHTFTTIRQARRGQG